MSTLTQITGKELERKKNNNGDQFSGGQRMRNASGYLNMKMSGSEKTE